MDAAVAEADVSPVEHPRDAGPLTAADLALLRRVFILNLVVLVLLRLIRDADDFSNWDLVGFLNANAFDSLAELLRRPEVHFRNPFSFPQYNVGAESTLSAILFHALGHVSLYWSNVIVVLVYDALFLFVVHRFFHLMYPDPFLETLAWLLLGMSPVTLTFAATSGFNMQAYTIVALGLLGCEYFIQGRPVVGTVLLAVAFCAISQAYPLAFFMPYFLVFWATFRTVMGGLPVGAGRLPAPTRQR